MRIVHPSVTLLGITPEAEILIEAAGRTCYKSECKIEPGSAGAFIRMIMGKCHDSVLEHASASFRVICDRGISHELVRHRIASFSQESTRYCNYGKDKFGSEISVIQPPGLRGEALDNWRVSCELSERVYLSMLAEGIHPQIARSVLPTCLKTELVMTANLREWRHILKLRLAGQAHPQIREIACQIRDQLRERCPNVFHDFQTNRERALEATSEAVTSA